MSIGKVPHLYHFCDIRNVTSVRTHGGIYSLEECERRGIPIPAPGGDETSQHTDRSKGFDKYVHLSFTAGHPMVHRARESGRIQKVSYVHVNRSVLEREGVLFVPGLANTTGIQTYSVAEAIDLGLIDFEILYTWTDWKVPANQSRRQDADKYEILVPTAVLLDEIVFLPNG